MALVLSNKSASLDTDRKHQETINNKDSYYPSPGIFVYTLPNIGIGEISIRHEIRGENAFFVFDVFNAQTLFQYAEALLQTKKSTHIFNNHRVIMDPLPDADNIAGPQNNILGTSEFHSVGIIIYNPIKLRHWPHYWRGY